MFCARFYQPRTFDQTLLHRCVAPRSESLTGMAKGRLRETMDDNYAYERNTPGPTVRA